MTDRKNGNVWIAGCPRQVIPLLVHCTGSCILGIVIVVVYSCVRDGQRGGSSNIASRICVTIPRGWRTVCRRMILQRYAGRDRQECGVSGGSAASERPGRHRWDGGDVTAKGSMDAGDVRHDFAQELLYFWILPVDVVKGRRR